MKRLALLALLALLLLPAAEARQDKWDGILDTVHEWPDHGIPVGSEFFARGHVDYTGTGSATLLSFAAPQLDGCSVVTDTTSKVNQQRGEYLLRLRMDADVCVWSRTITVTETPQVGLPVTHTVHLSGSVSSHDRVGLHAPADGIAATTAAFWLAWIVGVGLLVFFLVRDAIMPALVMTLYILTLFVPDVGYNLVVASIMLLLALWIHAYARGILPRFMRGAPPKA